MRTLDKPWHRDEKLRSGEAKLRLAWARFDNAARRQRKAPQHGVQQGQCGAAERRSARARRGVSPRCDGKARRGPAQRRRGVPPICFGNAEQSSTVAWHGNPECRAGTSGHFRPWQRAALAKPSDVRNSTGMEHQCTDQRWHGIARPSEAMLSPLTMGRAPLT